MLRCGCHTPPPVVISRCGAMITSPGTYVLNGDLTATAGTPCVTIQNTQNVILNCQNHQITTSTGSSQLGASIPVLVANAKATTIENCRIQASPGYAASLLEISGSPNSVVTGNTFLSDPSSFSVSPAPDVSVDSSDWINVSSNTFFVPYQQTTTSNSSIANNTMTCTSYECASMIWSAGGSGNAITGNVIDGKAGVRVPLRSPGADDGIVIGDESNDSVSGNTVSNNWDCGIETYGHVINNAFFNNTVNNSSQAGICSYHFTSMEGNTFHGNIVTGAPYIFEFHREEGLRVPGCHGWTAAPETTIYFRNNVFDGNTFLQSQSSYGAWFPFFDGRFYLNDRADSSECETVPTASQFVIAANSFSNNNFGNYFSFFGEPMLAGAVIDGGGNVCGHVQYADYPLACGR